MMGIANCHHCLKGLVACPRIQFGQLFSTDFKIRFKKFGISIDPKGRSGLSYRRRTDRLRRPTCLTGWQSKTDLSKSNTFGSTELDLRHANLTTERRTDVLTSGGKQSGFMRAVHTDVAIARYKPRSRKCSSCPQPP